METFHQKFIKAKDYFLNRVKDISDPETAMSELECAINDSANIFASSREEYQRIYDMLNNLAYTIVL